MPKHGRGKHKGGGGQVLQDPTVKVRGRFRFVIGSAVYVAEQLVTPLAMDQRLIELSDTFQEFRFTKLRISLFNSSIGSEVAVAYEPTILTTAPALAELHTLACYKRGNGQYGSGNPLLVVNRAELGASAPKWFRRGSPFDDLLETQGKIYYGVYGAGTFAVLNGSVLIEYEVELRSAAQASLTAKNPLAETKEQQDVDEIAAAMDMTRTSVPPGAGGPGGAAQPNPVPSQLSSVPVAPTPAPPVLASDKYVLVRVPAEKGPSA